MSEKVKFKDWATVLAVVLVIGAVLSGLIGLQTQISDLRDEVEGIKADINPYNSKAIWIAGFHDIDSSYVGDDTTWCGHLPDSTGGDCPFTASHSLEGDPVMWKPNSINPHPTGGE